MSLRAMIDAKAVTFFGWFASIGGATQLVRPHTAGGSMDADKVASYALTVASAIAALSGALILAYQKWREERRSQQAKDDEAFRASWEGKVSILQTQLALATAERDTFGRELESLRRQVDLLTGQINQQTHQIAEQNRLINDQTRRLAEHSRKATEQAKEAARETAKAAVAEAVAAATGSKDDIQPFTSPA